MSSDTVNHPKHYNAHPSGVECIDVVEHMNFNVGNAIKYLWRAGVKSPDVLEDLRKANWYVAREIERLAKVQAKPEPKESGPRTTFRRTWFEDPRVAGVIPTDGREPARLSVDWSLDPDDKIVLRTVFDGDGSPFCLVPRAVYEAAQLAATIQLQRIRAGFPRS